MIDVTVQNKAIKLIMVFIFENIDCFWIQCLEGNLHFSHWTHNFRQFKQKDSEKCMSNYINMFWYEVSVIPNI